MKIAKYLLLVLAALTFSCCGEDDDNDNPGGSTPDSVSTFTASEDYSQFVGANYKKLSQSFSNPDLAMDGFYSYSGENTKSDKVEAITFMLNTQEDQVYAVMEILKEGACKVADMKTYFAKSYAIVENEGDTILTFANNADITKATLTINVTSESIIYSNPTLAPSEPEGGEFADNPIDLADDFLGADAEYILEEYDGLFSKVSENAYVYNSTDVNDYVAFFGFDIEDGIITEMQIIYNEDMPDADIIAYYQSEGYTCLPTGNADEEGNQEYLFMNREAGFIILYCGGCGYVTRIEGDTDDDDDED